MVVRFWSARLHPEDEEEYLSLVRARVLPEFEKLRGYRGALFTKRPSNQEIEYRVLTLWDSLEAVRSMAGEDFKQAFVPLEIARLLKRFETTAEHFETSIEHGAAFG